MDLIESPFPPGCRVSGSVCVVSPDVNATLTLHDEPQEVAAAALELLAHSLRGQRAPSATMDALRRGLVPGDLCDDSCTVDCGHCKGAGRASS